MSSVEQKFREVIANKCYINPTYEELDEINEAVESILQIIKDDVIGENNLSASVPPGMPESIYNYLKGKDDLRDLQRANLREDK